MTNSQADSLIEKGRPLKELVPLFPDKVTAYEYFARGMTGRFASPDTYCAACGRTCDGPPMAFTWRANLHTAKTVIISFLFSALALFAAHLYSRWVVVQFTTFHQLCPECQRRHRIQSVIVGVLHKVLFAILMLLLFLTVPVIVFAFAVPFIAPEGIWVTLAGAVIGVGLLVLVAQGFEACRKSLIPKSLRQIGQFPFSLYALQRPKPTPMNRE
jgi:hypothetical protein